MIDYHCHILPGLDDGAVSVDESIAMARSLAEAGYEKVCCTPHCIKGSYESAPDRVREATLMLQADLDNAEIDLLLGPGMEYILDEYFTDFADNLMPLGNTRLVLCEASPQANPDLVVECLQAIFDQGFIPLIAHPERTQFFYEKLRRDAVRGTRHEETLKPQASELPAGHGRKNLGDWFKSLFSSRVPRPASRSSQSAETDTFESRSLPLCLFQANLGSFVNFYPSGTMERAYELLKLGAYHCLASDLHSARMGQKILKPGVEKLETNPLLKTLATRTPKDLYRLADQAFKAAEEKAQERAEKQGKFEF